ncbi:hypothetical protein LJC45_01390 [Alistipes sp. OttesenSCG-928-B03]|nr:hypothetical protein [Alistipes sp. OttesenSCG-928-B03]
MKLKNIYMLGLSCIFLALAACSDDPETPAPPTPPEPLPELAAPKDPIVSVKQAKKVVVEWVGDETATSYEVELGGRTIELEGTSCGMYVNENTDYTWKVRAIRGEESSEWVAGPPFKTLVYNDPRIDWIGYWKVSTWELAIDATGVSIPMDEIMRFIPEDVINAILDMVEFKLSPADEESEIPEYDELMISLDLLEELGLPEVAAVFLVEGAYTMERGLSIPLNYPGLPLDASEIPFLSNIPGLGRVENLMIRKLQLELTDMQIKAGPINGDTMLFSGSLGGRIVIETGDALIDMSISLMKPKMRLTFSSNVKRM